MLQDLSLFSPSTRRQFLKGASAAGAAIAGAALLAACGGSTASSTASTSPASSSPASSPAAASISPSSSAAAASVSSAASASPSAAASTSVAASPAAASASGAAGGSIKLGLHVPITGGFAINGLDLRNGAEMRVEEINAAGGIDGKKIELVTEDSGATSESATNAARKLLSEANVAALLTSYVTFQVLAVKPLVESQQVPTINSNTGDATNVSPNGWLFRMFLNDGVRGQVMVKYAMDGLKKSKLASVHSNDDYGNGIDKTLVATLQAAGSKLVADESYGPTDKDMTAQVLKVKDSGADLLLLNSDPTPEAIFVKQARQQGVSIPFLGDPNLSSPPFLKLLSDNEANGLYSTGPALATISTDPKVEDWVKKYQTKYGALPGSYGPTYYDAVGLFAQAYQKAGPDKMKLKDAIASSKYQGLLIAYSFDANGNGVHSVAITQNSGKTPKLLTTAS